MKRREFIKMAGVGAAGAAVASPAIAQSMESLIVSILYGGTALCVNCRSVGMTSGRP